MITPLDVVLDQLEEYLTARQDVVDGDYGVPAPNEEMTLLRELKEVREALARPSAAGDAGGMVATLQKEVEVLHRIKEADHRREAALVGLLRKLADTLTVAANNPVSSGGVRGLQDTMRRLSAEIDALTGAPKVSGANEMYEDIGCLRDQAAAWLVVADTLSIVAPDWHSHALTGMESACIAIRQMVAATVSDPTPAVATITREQVAQIAALNNRCQAAEQRAEALAGEVRRAISVLGPTVPRSVTDEGARWEWGEALRILEAALTGPTTPEGA